MPPKEYSAKKQIERLEVVTGPEASDHAKGLSS
jgi:hypothetical protein